MSFAGPLSLTNWLSVRHESARFQDLGSEEGGDTLSAAWTRKWHLLSWGLSRMRTSTCIYGECLAGWLAGWCRRVLVDRIDRSWIIEYLSWLRPRNPCWIQYLNTCWYRGYITGATREDEDRRIVCPAYKGRFLLTFLDWVDDWTTALCVRGRRGWRSTSIGCSRFAGHNHRGSGGNRTKRAS